MGAGEIVRLRPSCMASSEENGHQVVPSGAVGNNAHSHAYPRILAQHAAFSMVPGSPFTRRCESTNPSHSFSSEPFPPTLVPLSGLSSRFTISEGPLFGGSSCFWLLLPVIQPKQCSTTRTVVLASNTSRTTYHSQ
jgi:hypothetical protein